MRSSWTEEGWRIALILALAFVVGAIVGQLAWVMFAALLLYGLRSLYNLHRLVSWLVDPDPDRVPIHFGIWGDIYAKVQRMRAANHQRERRLGNLLAQFRASAAALPDAAIALGSAGEIRWFNDAARDLLVLRNPQDIGQPLVNLFRAPALARFIDRRQFDKTLEITAPGDRSRHLAIRVTPYGHGQMLLLAEDVTDRYLAEQVRKDFVANVSHELRTPLTVISGFTENLQHDEQLPERLHRPVELIEQQTERMRHIVEDLLLLARLESASDEAQRQPVDVRPMIQQIADEARTLSEGEIKVELEIHSDRWLEGESVQLRSAFLNLVVNAINHTPAGGQVTLRWRNDSNGCCFEVKDNGEGIPSEHVPRLTERFYRVDVGRSRDSGGTGLGLAIVKHVLQAHGARLEIESQVGHGSLFRCRFPASRCTQASLDLHSSLL